MNLFYLILNPYSFYIVHKLSNLPTISFLQSHVRCFKPLHSSFEMKRFHSSGCELTMGRFRLLLFLGSAASRQFIINIMQQQWLCMAANEEIKQSLIGRQWPVNMNQSPFCIKMFQSVHIQCMRYEHPHIYSYTSITQVCKYVVKNFFDAILLVNFYPCTFCI